MVVGMYVVEPWWWGGGGGEGETSGTYTCVCTLHLQTALFVPTSLKVASFPSLLFPGQVPLRDSLWAAGGMEIITRLLRLHLICAAKQVFQKLVETNSTTGEPRDLRVWHPKSENAVTLRWRPNPCAKNYAVVVASYKGERRKLDSNRTKSCPRPILAQSFFSYILCCSNHVPSSLSFLLSRLHNAQSLASSMCTLYCTCCLASVV